MKKLLWVSDAAFSGYALVTYSLLPYLLQDFEVFFLGINNTIQLNNWKELLNNNNILLDNNHLFLIDYNEQTYENFMGCNKLKEIINKINPDIFFTINDYQVLDLQINAIISSGWKGTSIGYMPVDCENLPYNFFNNLHKFDYVFAMNQFSKKQIENTQLNHKNEIIILEHPIKKNFKILNNPKQYRKKLFNNYKDTDILILNCNNNSYRKRLDLTLEAFYYFMKKNPQYTNLYLIFKTTQSHKNKEFDLDKINQQMIEKYGINLTDKLQIITNKYTYEELNQLYNCVDICLSTTSGEGWGLTPFELLSVNKFCLIPNNTSYTDYFPKIMLIKTNKISLHEGRKLEKINDTFYPLFRLHKKTVQTTNYIDLINHYNTQIYKLSPDSFQSLEQIRQKIQKDNPLSALILINIDSSNNFTFTEKIIQKWKQIDTSSYFPNYDIFCSQKNIFDSMIVKVGIIQLKDFSQKLKIYLTNKEKCDKVAHESNKKIISKLTEQKIGNYFLEKIKQITK